MHEDESASSFCVFIGHLVEDVWACMTGDDHSVFKKELSVTFRALEWIDFEPQPIYFHLYSENPTSLQKMLAYRTKHPLTLKIKLILKTLVYGASLGRVTVYIGIDGQRSTSDQTKQMISLFVFPYPMFAASLKVTYFKTINSTEMPRVKVRIPIP